MTTSTNGTYGATTDNTSGTQDINALMSAKAVEIVTNGYSGMNAIGIPIDVPAFTVSIPVDTWLTQASACGLPVDFFIDAITATAKDRIAKDKLFAAQLELAGITMSGRPRTSAINEQAKKLESIISAQTKIDEAENGTAETKLIREQVLFLLKDTDLDFAGTNYSWYTHDWLDVDCMNDNCNCGATETVNQRGAWSALLETAFHNQVSLSKLGGMLREFLGLKENQVMSLANAETNSETATVTYPLESTPAMPFGGIERGFHLYQFDNRGDKGQNPNSYLGWTGVKVPGTDISERLAVQQWIGADAPEYYDTEKRNNANAVVLRYKDALRRVGLNNANAVWNGALRTWDGLIANLPSTVSYLDNNAGESENYSEDIFCADLQALRVEYREPESDTYNYLSKWLYVGTKARGYSIGSVFTDAEKKKHAENAVPTSGVQAGIA